MNKDQIQKAGAQPTEPRQNHRSDTETPGAIDETKTGAKKTEDEKVSLNTDANKRGAGQDATEGIP